MVKKVIAIIVILLCITRPIEINAKTYTTKDNVYSVIKKNLMARNTEFTIEMNESTMEAIGTDADLFSIVAAIDDKDTSKDGDYLKISLSEWGMSWSLRGPKKIAKMTFTATYKTTLTQEKKLGAKIDSVLGALDLKDASDYDKVKAIHDYIIKRVSYDQTYKKYTAYNALINKSSVCEGYASAAYRMFTDAGIESRIVTGTADGGGHAWNIVKVDGKWYNIDLTWDDPIMDNGEQTLRYDFFLKNTEDFENHARDREYRTKAFIKKYPIAMESYKELETQ